MNVVPGAKILHYEVGPSIGKGGMGEVFRAHDTKLGRDVAIKVLPTEFVMDEERLARFEREARVLASLNHPHIASIYGFENVDGTSFLVMELAEGEDLSERIRRGPIPADEAIEIAAQIADALEAAHEKGIVHRDLKPANVKITPDGKVKVLDFGLAKALEDEEGNSDISNSPTMARAATNAGVILGTAAYMSPEQARGKRVDKRTDVWAFGVVLWEMLTGHRLFEGETVSDTLAAVLRAEPDWTQVPRETPTRVRRVLRRCLVRNPAKRLRDVGDAIVELHDETADDAATATTASPTAGASRSPWRFAPWGVALAAIAIALLLAITRRSGDAPLPLRKLTILPITDQGQLSAAVLSPDGRRVAYVSGDTIWMRDLDQTTPRRISDAKGFSRRLSFWSPDSRWLAFVSEDKLWKAPIDGSSPTLICEIPTGRRVISGAWDPRDRIILGQWRGGLLEVSSNGGMIRDLMKAPDDLVDYHSLSLLPDGQSLLGAAHLVGNSSRVDVIRDGRIVKKITLADGFYGNESYSPTGHVVFQHEPGGGVWAVPFSLDKLATSGDAFVIDSDGANPTVAVDGSLVYSRNIDRSPGRLVRVDWSGKVTGAIGEPVEDLQDPRFAPTGSMVAYSVLEKGDRNVWTLDLTTGTSRRITQFKGFTLPSSWSSDGRRLLVSRRRPDDWSSPDNGNYLADVAGEGEPKRVNDGFIGQLLPDGSGVLYWKFGLRNDDRLEWTTFGKEAKPTPFVASMRRATAPAMSPDGSLVAFESDDSGTSEIWVARFPSGEGRMQLSRGGGTHAAWSRDGRFLYYQLHDSIFRVSVTKGVPAAFGAPTLLFDGRRNQLVASDGFDVLPDGSGFVMIERLPLEDAAIIYVQNWFSEFKGRR